MSFEIEIRRALTEIADVNASQRIITVIAVPYEQPAYPVEYRGQLWTEIFTRGAFDGIEKRPNRVRVNREHLHSDTVGKAINFYPDRQEGLIADLKIAKTVRGDETLELAADDCLSSSVGYGLHQRSHQMLDRASMTRRINKAWLDHISLVASPAYVGADVIDVRDRSDAPPDGRALPDTPVLNNFLADPYVRRALGLESPSK